MRSESELMNYAGMYDFQKDSPFQMPDENILLPVDGNPMEAGQMVMDWDKLPVSADGQMDAGAAADRSRTGSGGDESPATNRGFARYQGKLYPDRWGGYDGGVEASIHGKWEYGALERLAARLEICKMAADNGEVDKKYIDLAGIIWEVKPTGASSGFFKYKWVIESRGVKVYIHSSGKKGVIPVRVRFGFECLARTDLFKAVETLRKVLESVGFWWESEIVSRVDMQVLLPVDIYEFTEALKGQRVVTRCRGVYQLNANMNTMRIETITLRSCNAELCIYDKRAQLLTADPVYFRTFCKEILQDGEIPKHLTRVEFRFRRRMLERYGITTFKDLRNSQAALPKVFGRDWFRILERDKVRGSENEIPDAPIWARTMKAFEHYFSEKTPPSPPERTPDDLRQTPKIQRVPQVDRLVKQAAGLLSAAASCVCEKFTYIEEVWEKSAALLKFYAEPMYFKGVSRQVENAVRRGYMVENSPIYSSLKEIQTSFSPDLYYAQPVEFG